MTSENTLSAIRVDEVFCGILCGINAAVIDATNKSVSAIIDLSMNYLSSAAQDALKEFYSLYFGPEKGDVDKGSVNQEVDDLFDQISSDLSAGKTQEQILSSLEEDEEKKKARLTISGFQKKLESLITLESEVRNKLVPALMAMQFEDVLRQRLSRIEALWQSVFSLLANNKPGSLDALREIGKDTFVGSHLERSIYYKVVLEKTTPPGIEEDETWFKN